MKFRETKKTEIQIDEKVLLYIQLGTACLGVFVGLAGGGIAPLSPPAPSLLHFLFDTPRAPFPHLYPTPTLAPALALGLAPLLAEAVAEAKTERRDGLDVTTGWREAKRKGREREKKEKEDTVADRSKRKHNGR